MGLNISSYQTDSGLPEPQVQGGGIEEPGAQQELKCIQVGALGGDSQIARATGLTELPHNTHVDPPPCPPI